MCWVNDGIFLVWTSVGVEDIVKLQLKLSDLPNRERDHSSPDIQFVSVRDEQTIGRHLVNTNNDSSTEGNSLTLSRTHTLLSTKLPENDIQGTLEIV